MRRLLAVAIAVVSLLLFYFVVSSDTSGITKFALAIALLALTSHTIAHLTKIEYHYGLLLLRTKKGLKHIDRIANLSPWFWKTLADFGLVLGFGISSIFISQRIRKRILLFLASLVILLAVSVIVLPNVLVFALQVIDVPLNFSKVSSSDQTSIVPAAYIIIVILLLGGLSIATLASLIANTFSIVFSVVSYFLGNSGPISETTPGASFVIPGITIDLWGGLIALIILVVVHEVAHGILARVAKIKLTSTGVVLFGFLPVGAFVDPDEKQLEKKSEESQIHVLVAGSTANFIACLLAFLLLYAYYLGSPMLTENYLEIQKVMPNSPAEQANITSGEILLRINGTSINTTSDFYTALENVTANSTLLLETNGGAHLIKTENGMLGVLVRHPFKRGFEIFYLFESALILTFVMNFLIGSVNLLPLPFFDGFRIISLGVKNEKIMNYVSLFILLCFLINFLPHLWA